MGGIEMKLCTIE